MQTFLPYVNFWDSAMSLDNRRLGKQRVECLQILKALRDPAYGWQNHPAVNMWRGFEHVLEQYQRAVIVTWTDRGFKNSIQPVAQVHMSITQCPPWLGDERFHSSHRAALLAKDPEWYGQFGWKEEPGINYWWPTKHQGESK